MSKDQQVTAVRVANIPDDVFEQEIEKPNPPSVTRLAELGKRPSVVPVMPPAPEGFARREGEMARQLSYAPRLDDVDTTKMRTAIDQLEEGREISRRTKAAARTAGRKLLGHERTRIRKDVKAERKAKMISKNRASFWTPEQQAAAVLQKQMDDLEFGAQAQRQDPRADGRAVPGHGRPARRHGEASWTPASRR